MNEFSAVPDISAVDYIVKKYSDTLPGDKARTLETPESAFPGDAARGYCPPCPPYPAPLPQPVPNISFRAQHTIISVMEDIRENIGIAYELSMRTSNKQAQYILRDYIAAGERDLVVLRSIFSDATGISPSLRPNLPPAGFFNNLALKAMFANQTAILDGVQQLKDDLTMHPYLPRLDYVMASEIGQMRRIGELYDLRA